MSAHRDANPYMAPSSTDNSDPMVAGVFESPQRPAIRVRKAIHVLGVIAILKTAVIQYIDRNIFYLLGEPQFADAVFVFICVEIAACVLVWTGWFLWTARLFFLWLHCVDSNSRLLKKQSPKYSAYWVRRSWFVPILHLEVPYHAVKEIWNRSLPVEDDSRPETPDALKWWWTFWIVGQAWACFGVYLFATFRWEVDSVFGLLRRIMTIDAGVTVLQLTCGFFAVRVIQLISELQDSSRRQITASI